MDVLFDGIHALAERVARAGERIVLGVQALQVSENFIELLAAFVFLGHLRVS